jgi:hypothetical protein
MYEKATMHSRSIKPPTILSKPLSRDQVHRERKLRRMERNIRLDDLNIMIRKHSGSPKYFRLVAEWRREQLKLLSQF